MSYGYIKADVDELAVELYRCTFGIKQLVVLLLKLAYVECRIMGRQCVNLFDITREYHSAAYTVSAGEVEELKLQAMSSRKKQKHKDLQSPFDLPVAMKTNIVNFTRADRHERVIATVFHSFLTEKERAAVKLSAWLRLRQSNRAVGLRSRI